MAAAARRAKQLLVIVKTEHSPNRVDSQVVSSSHQIQVIATLLDFHNMDHIYTFL